MGDFIRISDAERGEAISVLGTHLADGRLTMSEYDERVAAVTRATTHRELDILFDDLPKLQAHRPLVNYYSEDEIADLNRRGAKPRLGLMILSFLSALLIQQIMSPLVDLSFLILLLPATVGVLLYILKIGPAHWYTPTPSQLERQRRVTMQQVQAQRRRELTQEIQNNALEALNSKLEKWRRS